MTPPPTGRPATPIPMSHRDDAPAPRSSDHAPSREAVHHVQEHGSPVVRAIFLVVGILAFVLAVLGIFLPLLPATPLFLVAAACFARAYRPFHEWMLDHHVIGPPLREWYRHRSLPYRTKVVAVVTMLVSFGMSIVFVVEPLWVQLVLAAFAVALAVWLYRIPSRDGPGTVGPAGGSK